MTLLSLYRPNFCAHCGEKIVRLKWRLWTSRTFCGACVPKFWKEHLCRQLLLIVAAFGTGVTVGRALKSSPSPIIIQRLSTNISTQQTPQAATSQQAVTDEEIYTCGARTKKGTPCSRRVHGPVRCWQHKGLPAMLPLEKLKVK